LLPDGPTAAADVAQLREAALAARLQSFEAVPRAPVETAAVSHVVVDIAGNARFVDVERFFRQLGLLPRPIDVEALTLKATPEELVHLTAVVRFPYRSKKAPLPAPPVGARAPAGVPRPTLEALMRDHALAFAKSEGARVAAALATQPAAVPVRAGRRRARAARRVHGGRALRAVPGARADGRRAPEPRVGGPFRARASSGSRSS
jgi:hypothetical protein